MTWIQKTLTLTPKSRGFHLITHEILQNVPELQDFKIGIAHIFIQHTSASLAINENADPTVRIDMENYFTDIVPEDTSKYLHTLEGLDDMTSHIKSVMLGSSVSVPVRNGRFFLGTWQGIYLCEHRNRGGGRRIVVTVSGD